MFAEMAQRVKAMTKMTRKRPNDPKQGKVIKRPMDIISVIVGDPIGEAESKLVQVIGEYT